MSRSLLLRASGLLAAVAVVVPVAGCGSASSSSGSAGADPAHLLPASSPIYLEARVRPGGDLKTNVEAVAKKVLRTDDPGQKITQMIDRGLKDRGASYKKDVEPWLGERAGIAILGFGAGSSTGIAAIAAKDDGKAKSFIEGRKNTEKKTYRGVDYRFEAKDDTAAALVDHMVLVGDERGLKSAIDVSKGAAKLSDAKAFKEARDNVASDGLGFMYMDPTRLFDQALGAQGAQGAQQAQLLGGMLGGSGLRSIAASLEVAQDAVRLDAAVIGVKGGTGSGDGPGAAADVPADAWLSAGVGDVGAQANKSLDQLSKSGGIPGVNPQQLLQQLKSGLGVDVQKDFLSWMGDTAVFVRGASMDKLDGAVIVHSKDAAASQRSIGILRRLLPQMGVKRVKSLSAAGARGLRVPIGSSGRELDIVAKGDRFVVALGRAALADALGGGRRLGDTDTYKQATGLLGGQKASLFFDMPQVVQLVGALASNQASFQQALPALQAFGPAAAGVSTQGDVTHIKVAVAVK